MDDVRMVPIRDGRIVHAAPFTREHPRLKPGGFVYVRTNCTVMHGTVESDTTPVTCILCFVSNP